MVWTCRVPEERTVAGPIGMTPLTLGGKSVETLKDYVVAGPEFQIHETSRPPPQYRAYTWPHYAFTGLSAVSLACTPSGEVGRPIVSNGRHNHTLVL